ncbi:ATP-dependent RNA helicase chl1 [Pleurostoma richardsiae]|uniref:ATP-dependent DNA helicase CHL1 n=1 Tax=Pleurostoma richardsiae TaxID=41990 RepID=A0AA38RFE2_9PEZI|nr:ATP-dependent RNA helicase chl1 [Pleurostoma richardsiae]
MAGDRDLQSAAGEGHGDTPVDFHHPYTPYGVQLQFMRAVYDVLSQGDGHVGILESPTGTGKSLSLICASLTWLRNHKKAQYETSLQLPPNQLKDEPQWIVDQMLRRKRADLTRRWEEREQRLRRIREREKMMEVRSSKRRRIDEPAGLRKKDAAVDEEAEFLLKDPESGDGFDENDPLAHLSKETRALMEQVGMGSATKKMNEEADQPEDEIKIYYTSRTHSQLSQFISELRRPTFQSSLPESLAATAPEGKDDDQQEGVKLIPLSSRQKLCINPKVSRLGSLAAINDRCTELQQSKSKDKCPFVPNSDNLTQTHQFRDTALATLPDIEDMYRLGKTMEICPYYASRTAIPGAEIVTLPYPLLLQKSARDALGIHLEGNIVIVDEAHNIMDAVANVHAAEIRLSELRRARQMLGVYVKRFGKKLKGVNRVTVAQVVKVIDGLSEWLHGALNAKGEQGIVDPNTLMKHKGIDQINLFQLMEYIQESKLASKIESYASHIEEQDAASGASKKASTPVLHTLTSFISALTNLSTEGRIFFEKLPSKPPDIKLSYLLLSPTHAFSSIASSARAVILAGGTMSPFEDYKAHLFPYLPPEKITTLSCGHVIPPSNLCVWTLASTRPSGSSSAEDAFEFSFQKRSDPAMVRQLGLALLNICSVVPDGVVVFFPSYGYLDQVVAAWQKPDAAGSSHPPLWERLQAKKTVFRETKGGSSDEVLEEYSKAILGDAGDAGEKEPASNNTKPLQSTARGALLLSVVGGKMSEGINFSDRLGRCVVIVGLPYPNINSPEWKARIEYIESAALALSRAGSGTTPQQNTAAAKQEAKQAARDFYENACMRAVNQSIGRAIRHRGDYAAIVLVDRRFGSERIRGKLPGWIRGGMVQGSEGKGLQGLMGTLSGFFRGKRDAGQ